MKRNSRLRPRNRIFINGGALLTVVIYQSLAFGSTPSRSPKNILDTKHKESRIQAEIRKELVHLQFADEPNNHHRQPTKESTPTKTPNLKTLVSLGESKMLLSPIQNTPFIFDFPVTYNQAVSKWIKYFQNSGQKSFKKWLERSSRYLPFIQKELGKAGLPIDLGYLAMIESGFSSHAASQASAMGIWQFIPSTGKRYGLKQDWWIDERKDPAKATRAAIAYMSDLYRIFNSWYLVAAGYNMGENGVKRLIQKHGSKNYWDLADWGALPDETKDYVPKILAALLIAKAPALYGFRDLNFEQPLAFETIKVPGGTDLINLAKFLGVSDRYLRDLNPELTKGLVPQSVSGHSIRVPQGSLLHVSQYLNAANLTQN